MKWHSVLSITLLMIAWAAPGSRGANDPVDLRWTEVTTRNEQLKGTLNWFFGGKSQRGWHLYEPMISHFLGVAESASGEQLAQALAQWQKANGLPVSGILDQTTWMKMIAQWQARRSKDRTIPAAEKLVTVAADEFYDRERPVELRQVERATYAAYQRMVAAAVKDLGAEFETGAYLKIISAFRSPAYQQKLRTQSPHSGRAGLAVNSPHFTGRALDLYVGGEPVSTKDANRALQTNTKVYRWLVKNASQYGFIPYFYEPWHWEYNPAAASQ
jgi:LAS superfamily LD-carboxypeptidase LdcB